MTQLNRRDFEALERQARKHVPPKVKLRGEQAPVHFLAVGWRPNAVVVPDTRLTAFVAVKTAPGSFEPREVSVTDIRI